LLPARWLKADALIRQVNILNGWGVGEAAIKWLWRKKACVKADWLV
jgi:hypothetical protein